MVRVPNDRDVPLFVLCTVHMGVVCHISDRSFQNTSLGLMIHLRTCLLLVHSTQLTLSLLLVLFIFFSGEVTFGVSDMTVMG